MQHLFRTRIAKIRLARLILALLGLCGAFPLSLAEPAPPATEPTAAPDKAQETALSALEPVPLPDGAVRLSDYSYILPDGTFVQCCGCGPERRWGF